MNIDDFRNGFQKVLGEVVTTKFDRPIRDDELFSDYGLDSLDVMNLFLQLEDEFGVPLGEDVDPEVCNTLEKLFNFVDVRK